MSIRRNNEGQDRESRSVKVAALVGAIAVAILLVAAGTNGGAGVAAEAAAAAQNAVARQYEYFPANFPAPAGPVEPHIEAF